MRALLFAFGLMLPVAAFAAGSDNDAPPKPTNTTTVCADGLVWDEKAEKCLAPKESSLNDDALFHAARELAWAGRYDTARDALLKMSDPEDDRVLTYLGFIHRKSGEWDRGMEFYGKAIAKNPDNLLARSYRGQAFAEVGDLKLARLELREIRARGGRMTWPDIALDQAIRTGRGTAY